MGQSGMDLRGWRSGGRHSRSVRSVPLNKGDKILVNFLSVIDGDSLHVESQKHGELEIRLYAIDAPEYGQPYFSQSTYHLQYLASSGSYILEVMESSDRYGRVVGVLYDETLPWRSLNGEMVRAGMAFRWTRYGDLAGLKDAEGVAKAECLGVWRMAQGIQRPWDFRAKHGAGTPPPRRRQRRRSTEQEFAHILATGAFLSPSGRQRVQAEMNKPAQRRLSSKEKVCFGALAFATMMLVIIVIAAC